MKRMLDWWMWFAGLGRGARTELDQVRVSAPFRAWRERRPVLLALNGGIK